MFSERKTNRPICCPAAGWFLKRQHNSVNRSADRFSSQADRNSADSGAEILMHGPAEWRGGLE
eukprot:COSAG01_NODE_37_length_34085_cov_64.376626_25_plen_63_part_00